MKDFIEYLVKHLVDKPEEVNVTEVEKESVTIYELRVGEGDLGKVIGKGGQNARALRTLLNAATKKMGRNANLQIIE
ncbi:MAG: KH domain-containing protein, partial [Calditrichia bacterium]